MIVRLNGLRRSIHTHKFEHKLNWKKGAKYFYAEFQRFGVQLGGDYNVTFDLKYVEFMQMLNEYLGECSEDEAEMVQRLADTAVAEKRFARLVKETLSGDAGEHE